MTRIDAGMHGILSQLQRDHTYKNNSDDAQLPKVPYNNEIKRTNG